MIRYALACDRGHEFESWFSSSGGYEAQLKRGLVACPVCNSVNVEKQIMRPSLARTDKAGATTPAAPKPNPPEAVAAQQSATVPQPLALLSEHERKLRTMLKEIREHVTRNADNVGERFPDEARKMHYGEIEHRSIYGEASPIEARELLEEGIKVHPLPIVPEERN
jgi:hypothetical protein